MTHGTRKITKNLFHPERLPPCIYLFTFLKIICVVRGSQSYRHANDRNSNYDTPDRFRNQPNFVYDFNF